MVLYLATVFVALSSFSGSCAIIWLSIQQISMSIERKTRQFFRRLLCLAFSYMLLSACLAGHITLFIYYPSPYNNHKLCWISLSLCIMISGIVSQLSILGMGILLLEEITPESSGTSFFRCIKCWTFLGYINLMFVVWFTGLSYEWSMPFPIISVTNMLLLCFVWYKDRDIWGMNKAKQVFRKICLCVIVNLIVWMPTLLNTLSRTRFFSSNNLLNAGLTLYIPGGLSGLGNFFIWLFYFQERGRRIAPNRPYFGTQSFTLLDATEVTSPSYEPFGQLHSKTSTGHLKTISYDSITN